MADAGQVCWGQAKSKTRLESQKHSLFIVVNNITPAVLYFKSGVSFESNAFAFACLPGPCAEAAKKVMLALGPFGGTFNASFLHTVALDVTSHGSARQKSPFFAAVAKDSGKQTQIGVFLSK